MTLPRFKFIDPLELQEIVQDEHPRKIKAVECEYLVYNVSDVTIVRLNDYDVDDDGAKVYLTPDDVWQKIILAPPVGHGTQLFTSDKLLLPVIVINEKNEEDHYEIFNDGIVQFLTDGDAKETKALLNWIKSLTAKQFFLILGQAILQNYAEMHVRGGVNEFL